MAIADSKCSEEQRSEKNGKPLPAIVSLIAATAGVHDFSVVIKNTQDMEGVGIEVINPWAYKSNT